MAVQKLYAGVKLRELRSRLGLTQKAFAEKLGVSLPYLNQMENNNRPISTTVVVNLAQEFGFDVTDRATRPALSVTCARPWLIRSFPARRRRLLICDLRPRMRQP